MAVRESWYYLVLLVLLVMLSEITLFSFSSGVWSANLESVLWMEVVNAYSVSILPIPIFIIPGGSLRHIQLFSDPCR